MPEVQKVKITVDPPSTPLKSILRNQSGSESPTQEKIQDQIDHLQNRLKYLRESKLRQCDEIVKSRDLNAEKPEETEYLSPRGEKGDFALKNSSATTDLESLGNDSVPSSRFTERNKIYDSLSESTRARLEKLKQDRKNKNATAVTAPKPKFNYDKLEKIKNRFEGIIRLQ